MKNFLKNSQLEKLSVDLSERGYAQLVTGETEQLADLTLEICKSSFSRFTPAKIGAGVGKVRSEEIRRDKTLWIEEAEMAQAPQVDQVFRELLAMARENLYLPVKRYECHFSFYSNDDFYLKHKDRHQGSKNRLLTVLFYLNSLEVDKGGRLSLYLNSEETIDIQPQKGNLVVFDSEIEHEVHVCHADRWAISGWLRDDELLY